MPPCCEFSSYGPCWRRDQQPGDAEAPTSAMRSRHKTDSFSWARGAGCRRPQDARSRQRLRAPGHARPGPAPRRFDPCRPTRRSVDHTSSTNGSVPRSCHTTLHHRRSRARGSAIDRPIEVCERPARPGAARHGTPHRCRSRFGTRRTERRGSYHTPRAPASSTRRAAGERSDDVRSQIP